MKCQVPLVSLIYYSFHIKLSLICLRYHPVFEMRVRYIFSAATLKAEPGKSEKWGPMESVRNTGINSTDN